ncbi:hypothetical protein HOU02_gp410 [Caulobacter phage CcrBL9]|uniref:Uncharacterized protein n=1 Tax=Caulobacter phage CcrBL9 TaxID=2283270 RepID=A0A385EE73_9CAUD|nr:hypothetical protein HOU02_gp410 [Caulobacter phage CcrBL9]AXQ69315.1 hypothetical protein CcrBL9_gp291 [Caulobacter phage CcrBL9]
MGLQLDLAWIILWALAAGTGLSVGLLAEDMDKRFWGTVLGGCLIILFFWKVVLAAIITFYVFGAVLWGLGALHNLSVAKGWLR